MTSPPGSGRRRAPGTGAGDVGRAPPAEARFQRLDQYRVDREWKRFEGTAQRDLFRELRVRFLRRNLPAQTGPVLDVGAGPGRFTPELAAAGEWILLLDLSALALREARQRLDSGGGQPAHAYGYVVGNGRRPPLRAASLAAVALLGNLVGFSGPRARELLEATAQLVGPSGQLTVELSPGGGELSTYLHRLPATAVGRLLASPPAAVLPRVEREGVVAVGRDAPARTTFRRLRVPELQRWFEPLGLSLVAASAIAPALGADPVRCAACQQSPKSWHRLIELEEHLGSLPARWTAASSVLAVFRRGGESGLQKPALK
ncbi:MAG TPA: methyltransferase domain-containing protein [Thermoplasmata archaeon]|nr:methyltransferase domain-containing protein [Thermoplasmata archaeon]